MVSDERYAALRRQHDTIANAEPDTDEEAQLLREELGFEDNVKAYPGLRSRRDGTLRFLEGPKPPRNQSFRPFLPGLQKALPNLLKRGFPRRQHQLALLALTLFLWFIIFTSFLMSSQLPIRDGDGKYVVNIDCADTLWRPKNECGVDGIDCRPFENTSFSFRCPANCASVKVLNPRSVGPLDVSYRPLVIGDGIYRGDSFLCGSAIHAGIITDHRGGCGRINLAGENENYPSVLKNDIESILFDSYFPKAFSISSDTSFRCPSDPRSALLFVSLFFTSLMSLFATSASIFFSIFTLIFAHVSFVSDPPSASYRNTTVLPDHISMFAKRLLPASFCAIVIYRTTIKPTLTGLTGHVEKTIFWLGGFFFGALSNYTFDWIPISRLTARDLKQQPGAILALAIILIVLVMIISGQVYSFWLEGRLPRYLALYVFFILAILFCLAIPGVSLRLHHYILGLLLLPGTNLQTRSSLLYQGILLGLFVNGIARWDFDSVLQTTNALRGDGKFESAIPKLLEPTIARTAEDITAVFSWTESPAGMDGISVLVNDVERVRTFFNDGVKQNARSFKWVRPVGNHLNEYLRFAYVVGGRALDYTNAGTLFGNGTWSMEQDVSQL
ncbi:hypothetical protein K458DRAFT_418116 [Lentithecium fluviatile CBS 122367]|uniref:LCCL domain-containing protein n=1 Tax=Lentithecium fluviatile CBS 122367 TaxID=1168545 RepID=A0A6G1J2W6_9PLEO|nr:hypothetical protein K458DRAFT_418116 [Lentithecium fluviatile CBS 122367]